MSMPDPVAVFRIEAAELLEQIETGLLDLTHRLNDKDQIDAVFDDVRVDAVKIGMVANAGIRPSWS